MKINKCFILIFIFYILSTFFSVVSAFSSDDYDFYNLYTYSINDNSYDDMKSYVDTANLDNRVVSGEYYYFVYRYAYKSTVKTVFLKKSDCDYIYFAFNGDGDDLGTPGFNFFNGSNYELIFNTRAYLDSENRSFSFDLCTNFDKDILIDLNSIDTVYLLHNSPYIADDNNTIARLNGSYFLIYPNNSSIENLHFSLCKTETVTEDDLTYDRETVLADFSLNSSSPYYNCPLGDEVWYEVPYSDFPSGVSIINGEEYNWRLQYDLNGKTYYVDRNIVSLVDFSFNGSTRWR